MTAPLPPPAASDDDPSRLLLSCLVDGDGSAETAVQASAMWQGDAAMRSTWHGYQLIGDVMRSTDLASSAHRDAMFLAQLRGRLAAQSGVASIAPASASSAKVFALPARNSTRWLAPVAIAAGFVAVAGALVVTRLASPGVEPSGTPQLAVQTAAPGLQRAALGAASQSAGVASMDAELVRDAEIDRYFRAHRDMRVSPSAALPGGALRSVDTIVPAR